ncbi:MAG: hypothetical protein IPI43_32460 [Sandaracinaceae bacterium]|nr:hypothetical protein [Sandaracinaceae bacterium]
MVNLRPDVPYFQWGAEWAAEAQLRQSTEDAVKLVVIPTLRWLSECPAPVADDDYRRPNVLAAVRVADHPAPATRAGHGAHGRLVRAAPRGRLRAGHPARRAVPPARQALEHRNHGGHRAPRRRRRRSRHQWYRYLALARGRRPHLHPAQHRRHAAERAALGRTIAAYREVLAQNPKHRHAEVVHHRRGFKKTGNPAFKFALYDQASTPGRAWQLLCDSRP